MQRWFRLSTLIIAFVLSICTVLAQKPLVQVTGRIGANEVQIFLQDNVYQINGTYTVAGTLIIEPGTEVVFLDNSRIIDSVGGRIIADSRLTAAYNGTSPTSIAYLKRKKIARRKSFGRSSTHRASERLYRKLLHQKLF